MVSVVHSSRLATLSRVCDGSVQRLAGMTRRHGRDGDSQQRHMVGSEYHANDVQAWIYLATVVRHHKITPHLVGSSKRQ